MLEENKIVVPPENELFEAFPKIPRLFREVVITEKIDGTNAIVNVLEDGRILVGSRNRWITPESDNAGFARWVKENEEELRVGLGFGRHYGEWWGASIGRKYGLDHKRFSLFNTARWADDAVRPKCCHVVPVLYEGPFSLDAVNAVLLDLKTNGSKAAPGFMRPEGVITFHKAANAMFKSTVEDDEKPKGSKEAS